MRCFSFCVYSGKNLSWSKSIVLLSVFLTHVNILFIQKNYLAERINEVCRKSIHFTAKILCFKQTKILLTLKWRGYSINESILNKICLLWSFPSPTHPTFWVLTQLGSDCYFFHMACNALQKLITRVKKFGKMVKQHFFRRKQLYGMSTKLWFWYLSLLLFLYSFVIIEFYYINKIIISG